MRVATPFSGWVVNSTVKGQWPTADKYQIGNSGMFSSGSSQQLVNTPSPTGNTQTYTISAWIKKTMVGTNNGQDCYLFSSQAEYFLKIK